MAPAELAEALRGPNPPHLLDVREPDEFSIAALPNARLIPLAHVPGRAGEISEWKDQEVVVYCHHGVRSQMAIGALRMMGFKRLHNLSGGIDAWACEVDPTVQRY